MEAEPQWPFLKITGVRLLLCQQLFLRMRLMPLQQKLLASKSGTELADQWGCSHVIFESDCLEIIHASKGLFNRSWSKPKKVSRSISMVSSKRMESCRKPSSVQLTQRLVYSNILGLDPTLRNGSLKDGTLNMEMLQFKSKFPREVLLCRTKLDTHLSPPLVQVGDFYEAIGFDACILVEHAGLNPFGGLRSDSIPKAGCPIMCIVEEIQGPTQARARKGRFISGHAHPGSPYVFGLAEVDHDLEFPDPMPVVGISRSAKGYCLISVLETMKTYSAEEGLTEEAIVTKLRICRYHHLYLHSSLRNNSSGLGHGVSKASGTRLGPERPLILDLRNKVTRRGLGSLEDTFIAVFPDHPWGQQGHGGC
ncbi:unnamed protein product [Triticum turgidum subsp. durum]|uniref:Uncharacterized protein n=1 Tax=Triticum turgidum subsp. durum TaxID=4567 RepID=A0A9R1P020_TRITD|nr:unnamed protein product [Triticum turgidum subsp. durum]